MDELKIVTKKRCYDLGGSGGDDISLWWWVESMGVVNMGDSGDSLMFILPLEDPSDDRPGLLPFDPEVDGASTVGSSGDDTILTLNVWAGLGGGVGGASLLPGEDVLTLKWSSRGLTGGGVISGPGLERGRGGEREIE